MQPKKSKARNVKTNHGQTVDLEAKKILRTLNPSESFHFYEAIGKPTGQNASSLIEFLEKIKTVKAESLQFHLERKDFQNWIQKTLGDTTLARRIGETGTKHEDNIRVRIQLMLERRIKELAGSTVTMIVNMEQTVTRQEVEA